MKKFVLAIIMAVVSIGAYASTPISTIETKSAVTNTAKEEQKITKSEQVSQQAFLMGGYTYISSCGEVWDITYTDNASNALLDFAESLADAACGTNYTWFLIIQY